MELVAWGDTRIDDWFWLNGIGSPDVRSHLRAENDYADRIMSSRKRLRDRWEQDWLKRQADFSVVRAFAAGGFRYEWQSGPGLAGRLARRPIGKPTSRAEVVVDLSVYGLRSPGFGFGNVDVSPDNTLVAFTFERLGAERYTLRVRSITARRDLGWALEPVGPSVTWLTSSTLLFTQLDSRGKPSEVWACDAGSGNERRQVYREDERAAFVGLGRCASGAFAKIISSTHDSQAVQLVGTSSPALQPLRVSPLVPGFFYDVEHHPDPRDRLIMAVHAIGGDDVVLEADLRPDGWESWQPLYRLAADQQIQGFTVSARDALVAEVGHEPRLTLLDLDSGAVRSLPLPTPATASSVGLSLGGDFRHPTAELVTAGPLEPISYLDFDLQSGAVSDRQQQPAPRRFRAQDYECEHRQIESDDGTGIPLTLLYRKDLRFDSSAPTVLRGYGSYGISMTQNLSLPFLTLLDRGWVVALAHVRGGGEGGPGWHRVGQGLRKPRAIADFLLSAQHLISNGVTSPAHLAARGASAGGLLVCAAMNQRPELFRAVVAEVPFVDTLTSLLDPSRRLTASDWLEFGNPLADEDAYHCIRSYSPYDNIASQDYPALLLTAGVNDPRVGYWEPAKFAVKLRAKTTGTRPILVKVGWQTGHSGRWEGDSRSEESFVMAFLVSQLEPS
jgi:oligopeptidase B